jgi:hypothetical protein
MIEVAVADTGSGFQERRSKICFTHLLRQKRSEVPILLTHSLVVAVVFCAGWLIIFAYTFYIAWDLRTSALLNYDTGVIRFLGSVFAIALARGLYGSRLGRFHPRLRLASCGS